MFYDLTTVNFSTVVDGKMTFSNFGNETGKIVEMVRFNYMSMTSPKQKVLSDLTIKFVNKTDGKVFNLQSDDMQVN